MFFFSHYASFIMFNDYYSFTNPYLVQHQPVCVFYCLYSSKRNSLYAGDVNSISIGSGTNIQDNSLVHVAKSNLAGKVLPTIIGNNVTVGEWHLFKRK